MIRLISETTVHEDDEDEAIPKGDRAKLGEAASYYASNQLSQRNDNDRVVQIVEKDIG